MTTTLHLASFLAAVLAAAGMRLCAATQYLHADDDTWGVAPLPAAFNTWTAAPMYVHEMPKTEDRTVTGADFFLKEFGVRLKPFSFSNGYHSETWGRTPDRPGEPAIRFGRGWGASQGRQWGVRADITQDADATEWRVDGIGGAKNFTIKAPKGRRTTVLEPVGVVRALHRSTSLSFACLTTNVSVKVHSFELVPFTEPIHWRGTFVLGFRPWKAGLSFRRRRHYTFKINGKTVSKGPNVENPELLREDITACLHSGTNVFDVFTQRTDGYSGQAELAVEAFAISGTGERAMLVGGPNWKVRYKTGGWIPVAVSSNPAGRMGGDWSPGKVACCTGVNPMHAGPLQARHLGPEYPVFDCDAAEIAYSVATPPKMGNLEVALVVSNSLTGAVAERTKLKVSSGTGETRFRLKTREPGPYRLHWTLLRDGREADRDSMECVIAGPIAQTECTFGEFDKVLESRMRLVQERSCVPDERDPAEFAEHASPHFGRTRTDAGSRVVRENGIAFREAGAKSGDWFGYRLDIGKTGTPHILEVDYPDTHEQVLYVSVCENLPANFVNHGPGSANRLCNATGAVRTGWMAPLSGGRKTMRILFFPASRNVTVTFENHVRAAVCGFRVYEVPEGLPALRLPATERLWGTHCERPLSGIWGAAMCAKAFNVSGEYFENAYLAAYLGIRNRIAQLRYLGQNLAIEGVYMYKQHFPTLSGESQSATPGFDYCYIMSKMYRHNGIRALAGFEYVAAPSIVNGNGHDVGEREMRSAKAPCTPAYGVDRSGRQTVFFDEGSLNFLVPSVRRSMTNLVAEIYRRYEPAGGFEGLFVVCNHWWLPGFCAGGEYAERDVGYDDLSAELFQKETGIDLGIPYAPDRFARRHEALTGRHAREWYGWRARKVREVLEDFGRACSTGRRRWSIYAVPGIAHRVDGNPFEGACSPAVERDGYCGRMFLEAGFPPEMYAESEVRMVPRMKFAREHDLALWGMQTSRSAREMYARADAVYLEPKGLNERAVSTAALDRWWWAGDHAVAVFDCKASPPASFFDMVDICSGHAPKLMVSNWLDVNIPTAHGRESRRFATGFAAMPAGEYRPFPKVTGVQAEICGDDAVRLVNDTPYEVRGELVSLHAGLPAEVVDAFDGRRSGRFAYSLPGFGITVLRGRDIGKRLSGAFRFADPSVETRTLRNAAALADGRMMLSRVSDGVRKRFLSAWRGNDVYSLAAVLRDYEILRVAGRFFDLVLDAPQRPAAELKVTAEHAGSVLTYTKESPSGGCRPLDAGARDTARKTTFSFLVKTDGRAGDVMVYDAMPFRCDMRTFAGREGVTGSGLNVSITCFREKAGQKGWYSVGMHPHDGAAKDVWHHVCMTIDPESVAAVWVNGVPVDARELTDHHGLAFEPKGTGISFGRVCPKGQEVAGISIARMARRDGVMDWRDIQREAEEWLAACPTVH